MYTVLLIIFIAILYLLLFDKRLLYKHFPWLWDHVLIHIRNYFFVITPKKILLMYFRSIVSIAVFFPIAKLVISFYDIGSSNSIIVDFTGGSYDWMQLAIAIIISVVYIIYILREGHIDNATEIKDGIVELGDKIDTSNSMLSQITVKTSGSEVMKQIIPQLEESIDKLYLKQGRKIYEAFELEIRKMPTIDYELLAYVEYGKGQCSRYTNKANCIGEFNNAFDYMLKAGIYNVNPTLTPKNIFHNISRSVIFQFTNNQ
jgi:hypothetical protein